MSANDPWLARSRAAIWHPCTQMKVHEMLPLLPIARAEGAWLTDFDGRRYLDAVSSWWVNLFGHGNARIGAAIAGQFADVDHVMLAGFTHQPAIELAERLASLAPPGLGHAFFASDGASAVEIAIKMSVHCHRNRGRAKKCGLLYLAGGYHGETLGALAVTDVALFRDAYAPLLVSHVRVESPVPRDGEPARDAAQRAAGALDRHLAAHHADVAALILEPLVQGASGMRMYDPLYIARARELCTRYDVHLIADEIMTGFGRTGTMFACAQAGVAPDLLCMSKGLTGGVLPLSAVLASEPIYASFYDDDVARAFLHSHSYTGNALACRAALAVLDIFRDDDVLDVNVRTAKRWHAMAAPISRHPRVRDFRQRGMIIAFDVASGRADFARWFFAEALRRGLLLRPIGDTVYFMPPYVVTDGEFAMLVERTLQILDAA